MLIYSNDGSGWDTGINVGGTIKWIEYDNVFVGFLEDNLLGISLGVSNEVNLRT
jgi:hypothetical protein